MKNRIIYIFKSKIKLKVVGININRFITRLNANDIEILRCNYINKDTIEIIIYLCDYEELLKIKTIYEIDVLNTYGAIKIKKKLNVNKYLIISFLFGYALLLFLSNVIFDVEVIHNDSEVRNLIYSELNIYGLKKKTIKKSFKQIEKIKEEILNKNKDKIEWLEIETKGTKYIVRVEERKINEKKDVLQNRDVIAKKSAIIKEIKATSGQIVKEVNNYVNPGDVIISGSIYLDETLKEMVPADGVVFGEVWYDVIVTYPYVYNEIIDTSNVKYVYAIQLLNKNIELFNFHGFKNKKIEEEIVLKNSVIPFKFVRQMQTEQIVVEDILTHEQAINKALEKGIKQINDNLKEDEHIINYKILNTNIKEQELELKIFFSVYENITDYKEITDILTEN